MLVIAVMVRVVADRGVLAVGVARALVADSLIVAWGIIIVDRVAVLLVGVALVLDVLRGVDCLVGRAAQILGSVLAARVVPFVCLLLLVFLLLFLLFLLFLVLFVVIVVPFVVIVVPLGVPCVVLAVSC